MPSCKAQICLVHEISHFPFWELDYWTSHPILIPFWALKIIEIRTHYWCSNEQSHENFWFSFLGIELLKSLTSILPMISLKSKKWEAEWAKKIDNLDKFLNGQYLEMMSLRKLLNSIEGVEELNITGWWNGASGHHLCQCLFFSAEERDGTGANLTKIQFWISMFHFDTEQSQPISSKGRRSFYIYTLGMILLFCI